LKNDVVRTNCLLGALCEILWKVHAEDGPVKLVMISSKTNLT